MASVHLARPFTQRPAQPPQILKSGISLISTEYQREKFSRLNDHLCSDLGTTWARVDFSTSQPCPDAEKIEVRQNFFSTEYP
jgi:hypothetical protein